jgi:hypothetical protein
MCEIDVCARCKCDFTAENKIKYRAGNWETLDAECERMVEEKQGPCMLGWRGSPRQWGTEMGRQRLGGD